ncbi:MAG: protoporphyrinogen oxidase [Pseudomonadota bacterium]|nr:MAG: protoporphyrinogen oxidase [Pseudomonadota bacterium]
MSDILIIGAGISGLASACFLKERGHNVRVIEAAAEPGGCMRTVTHKGYLIEAGPNSTLSKGGAFDDLVRVAGLEAELIEGNVLAKRRYVVKHGVPTPLPGSPPAFFKTSLFSVRAKFRLFAEPFIGRAKTEETVAQFVRRRLGQEFLDWAIDPFVSGVYAGDPDKLSARAATAKVYALEAEHGSLIRGALARALRGKASGPQPRGRLVSFRAGMQALPRALAMKLGDALQCDAGATALTRNANGRWQVTAGTTVHEAEHVVLATAAEQAAALVEPLDAALAAEMRAIYYPPVASVALGFARAQVRHPLDGFGMLIPSRERLKTLGALFSSTLFPGRAPAGEILLTAFIGGARNPSIAELSEAAIVEQVLADLRALLGIDGEPTMVLVNRWARAIPQYELGHLERIGRIDEALAKWPGLHTRANWRDGISVADCISHAQAFAARFT